MADREAEPQLLPEVLPPTEALAVGPAENTALAREENEFFEKSLSDQTLETARLRNEMAKAHIKNVKADRKMRVKYAGRILAYLEFYSGGVLLLLLLSGWKPWGFSMQAEILAALVGSTALAAIGLVGFIARGLFKPPPAASSTLPPSE